MDVMEKLVGLLFKCSPKNIKAELCGEKIEVAISQGKIADYLIANGVTVQEWISVKDRLPEENTEVLIYCKTNSGKEVFFVDKICYFRGLPIWQVWSEKVTHWMPLPEPPKGE